MQIKIAESNYVVFTGAIFLAQTLKMIPADKFPFITTIIEKEEHFEFS